MKDSQLPILKGRAAALLPTVGGLFLSLISFNGTQAEEPKTGEANRSATAESDFFEAKVRPLLVKRCYVCHSAQSKQKGELSLDTKSGWERGGQSGAAILPGNPDKSLLIQAVRYDGLEMPPNQQLEPEEIAILEQWVRTGAYDPRTGDKANAHKSNDPRQGRHHWAFIPPRDTPAPAVKNPAWMRSKIDAFVLARLERENITPVPRADPAALIRRVTFDLIGLPPKPEEVEEFVHASSLSFRRAVEPSGEKEREKERRSEREVDPYEELVDRLLVSSHFGERWGRHWLDLARFAESNGNSTGLNLVFHHAWRYRDYVIAAFNDDKPYNQFVREQVAGDLLPATTLPEHDAQRIATGFLALGSKSLLEPNADIFRMDLIDEQINVLSRVFLGLSVACARCHDHKFDPIPTYDYYALAGILRSTQTLYGTGLEVLSRRHAESDFQPIGPDAERLWGPVIKHRKQVKEAYDQHLKAQQDRVVAKRKVHASKEQMIQPDRGGSATQQELARAELEYAKLDEQVTQLANEHKQLRANPPPAPDYAMAARDADKLVECRIHLGGDTANLGDTVPRGLPQVVPLEGIGPIGANESGRLHLADWLAHPHNPLTARVMVNRVWKHLFGRGLVASPDEFGIMGDPPSHPELLDHLATQFVADGWSIKKLIRRIVLSQVYQLGSDDAPSARKKDADNALLWHMRPRALEAEAFRDAILAVSGQLEIAPPRPSVLVALDPRGDQYRLALSIPSKNLEPACRSVYLPVIRLQLPELFRLFDFPSPDAPAGLRNETIVPAQSSYLLNSPWMIQQAKFTAQRLLCDDQSDEQHVDRLYLLALARLPSDVERRRALEYLQQADGLAVAKKRTASEVRLEKWTSLCQALLASAEFRCRF